MDLSSKSLQSSQLLVAGLVLHKDLPVQQVGMAVCPATFVDLVPMPLFGDSWA